MLKLVFRLAVLLCVLLTFRGVIVSPVWAGDFPNSGEYRAQDFFKAQTAGWYFRPVTAWHIAAQISSDQDSYRTPLALAMSYGWNMGTALKRGNGFDKQFYTAMWYDTLCIGGIELLKYGLNKLFKGPTSPELISRRVRKILNK